MYKYWEEDLNFNSTLRAHETSRNNSWANLISCLVGGLCNAETGGLLKEMETPRQRGYPPVA